MWNKFYDTTILPWSSATQSVVTRGGTRPLCPVWKTPALFLLSSSITWICRKTRNEIGVSKYIHVSRIIRQELGGWADSCTLLHTYPLQVVRDEHAPLRTRHHLKIRITKEQPNYSVYTMLGVKRYILSWYNAQCDTDLRIQLFTSCTVNSPSRITYLFLRN